MKIGRTCQSLLVEELVSPPYTLPSPVCPDSVSLQFYTQNEFSSSIIRWPPS